MTDEQKIRRLMQAGIDAEQPTKRVSTVLGKVRRQTGQRDTISFALFRIWAVLARLLAPLFAAFGEQQAKAIHQTNTSRKDPAHLENEPQEGEDR